MSRLSQVLILSLLVCPVAFAQEIPSTGQARSGIGSTRSVSGSVTLRGLPLAPISVTITSSTRSFQRTVFADSSGSFSIGGVPVGNYTFEIESEGYKTTREQIEIPPGSGVFPVQFMLNPLPVEVTPMTREPSISLATLNLPEAARREYRLGEREVQRRNWSKARKHFEKALEIHADFPQALHELARIDFLQNQRPEALARLRRSVEIDPSFFEGQVMLSFLLNETGHSQEALEAAARAIPLRPADWRGYYHHGMAALFLGRNELARNDSDRLESLEGPKPPDVRLLRVGVLLNLGRKDEAKDQLRAFLKEAPRHRHASLARQTLTSLGEPASESRN